MLKLINNLEHVFLGKVDFESAFQIQKKLWSYAKNKNQVSIMGLEHPAVITLGRRVQKNDQHIINQHINDQNRSESSLPIIQTTRGGLATIHSEGQLVIYPIVNLKEQKIGVKEFVKTLLQITQKTFQDFEIESSLDQEQIGLYTKNGKIAFCGLEINQGVSQHGISINIANDLSLFDQIISCGVQRLQTDKLQNYRADVTLKQFFKQWIHNWTSERAINTQNDDLNNITTVI